MQWVIVKSRSCSISKPGVVYRCSHAAKKTCLNPLTRFTFAAMKRLLLLLPFYLLFLSCMPCADSKEENGGNLTAVSGAAAGGHEKQDETCSPFCSCNCCGQRVSNNQLLIPSTILPVIIPKQHTIVKPFFLQNVSYDIWQPPQLV